MICDVSRWTEFNWNVRLFKIDSKEQTTDGKIARYFVTNRFLGLWSNDIKGYWISERWLSRKIDVTERKWIKGDWPLWVGHSPDSIECTELYHCNVCMTNLSYHCILIVGQMYICLCKYGHTRSIVVVVTFLASCAFVVHLLIKPRGVVKLFSLTASVTFYLWAVHASAI